MDVRKTVTDAGYIAIGLGVMGYQQAQTRRRELTTKLGEVPGKLGDMPAKVGGVPTKLSGVPTKLSEVPGRLSEVPGKLGELGKLSTVSDKFGAVPGKVEERGREVQGFLAEGSRQLGARGVAARGRAEDQVRVTVNRVQEMGGEVAKFIEPVRVQVQSQLGDLPERVVQVIEPVAAKVRERTSAA